ncbi:hypothetical protein cyc_05967 [Cyclospora cayetanensis]|uniref:Uncharacterized protein n=1 Tax=Cyclospora cayetanensis TaxID=88456 RepID=A0A1D3CSQ1_9EIME|nr:hypothetical protein cyc_05967 [Cyclospora cayetanensis]
MEYTEVFYIQQPSVADLGIPNSLVAPEALAPQLHPAQPGNGGPPHANAAPTVVVKTEPPPKVVYPQTRLPSEEELASAVGNMGSA